MSPSARPRRSYRVARWGIPIALLLMIAGVMLASAPPIQANPLPQATPVDIKVDFTCQNGQDSACTGTRGRSASGYLRDVGEAYGDRGNGASYGWVTPGTTTPLNLFGNGVDRGGTNGDIRLDTLMQMQAAGKPAGAWELALPNGIYNVTVGVGDGRYIDSTHRINVEGEVAITGFTPVPDPTLAVKSAARWDATTITVDVGDGRLTIDAIGGTNTKITHVIVQSQPNPPRPYVSSVVPRNSEVSVLRNAFVAAEVYLPNVGGGVDERTLNSGTVKLWRVDSKNNKLAQVAGNLNTSGGGDVIVLQPAAPLGDNQKYLFEVLTGVADLTGAPFLPFSSVFTTGSAGGANNSNIVFDKVALATAQGQEFTSLAIGPDSRLYAGTLGGDIYSFPILQDGTLGAPQVISTIKKRYAPTPQYIIGLAFRGREIWVSHNHGALANAPDLSGKITRLVGSDYSILNEFVTNLPRSAGDHMSNSLAFGPDGALYVTQGSMTAMGAPDNAWGQRSEHLLSGALLRINIGAIPIASRPLDARTADAGGNYNPYAAGAPLTLYATGIRNAYDLVFHSNGRLYVPTNGSASGGNTPETPATTCSRGDGQYNVPAVPGLVDVRTPQNDWLFRVVKGGYYGHPNPLRCEWVMNGGNPTSSADFAQVAQYPLGTQPDRNYRGAAFDFGVHFSPNGAIEYRSNANNGALKGKLLVVRYSGGDDIIILTPNGPDGNVPANGWEVGNPGLTGFRDPLDIVEHTATGNLYVTELGAKKIALLKPRTPPVATTAGPESASSPEPMQVLEPAPIS